MQARAPDPGAQNQLHLSLFAPHEIHAWAQEECRKRLRKEQRSLRAPRRLQVKEDRVTRGLFDSVDLAMLHNPLGGPAEGNELNCDVDPLREDQADADHLDASAEDAPGWSDEAVEQLHEAVLHYSLKSLQARGNGAEKREVLNWIFAPQPKVAVLRNQYGHRVEALLPQSLTPFSFEQCCRICGYSSERLIDGLTPILREMGLGNVFNEIANGRNNHNETRPGAHDEALPDSRHIQHP